MSTDELPDFSAHPAWMDRFGEVETRLRMMNAAKYPMFRAAKERLSRGPWTPLDTAEDRAKQRDDPATAAAELSERTLMTASEAMAVLIAATDWIGAEKLTRDQWVKRIDRDKLAEVIQSHLKLGYPIEGLEPCCSECGFAFEYQLMPESVRHSRNAEHLAHAVLAALPELMKGESDE